MKSSLSKKFVINELYEVKYFIEKTTFCEIYSVVNLESGELLTMNLYNAAKVARDDFDENGTLREISFLKLRIKGLPIYYTDGEFKTKDTKYIYYLTQYISGESVLDRIKRKGPFNEFDATKIINEVLKTTQILHSFEDPILLNGVSLDNLMIDMSGPSEKIVIRNIINFRSFTDNFKLDHVDGVNPNYLASETFNDVFTTKGDIYNLGALFYTLLHAVPPWFVQSSDENPMNPNFIDKLINSRSKNLTFPFEHDDHIKLTIKNAVIDDVDSRFNSVEEFQKTLLREKLYESEVKSAPSKKAKPKKGNGFKDIAGMYDLKEILRKEVIDVINEKEKYERYGVTIPNGMLLYGPPGCGKTFVSEKFAEEIGFNFIQIAPSDLGSIYIHGAQEKIGSLFAEAEKSAPSIIFFDEVDALMPNRGGGMNQNISAEVNEFLAQMTNCSKRGIFVIAATNQPDLIDDAILRTGRLDQLVYVANPDFDARKAMFELYLGSRPIEIGIDYSNLAKLTDNYVSSDIKYIIDKASRQAAEEDVRISNDILKEVINNFRPSVSVDVLNKYLDIKNRIENNKGEKKDNYKPIGF